MRLPICGQVVGELGSPALARVPAHCARHVREACRKGPSRSESARLDSRHERLQRQWQTPGQCQAVVPGMQLHPCPEPSRAVRNVMDASCESLPPDFSQPLLASSWESSLQTPTPQCLLENAVEIEILYVCYQRNRSPPNRSSHQSRTRAAVHSCQEWRGILFPFPAVKSCVSQGQYWLRAGHATRAKLPQAPDHL